MTSKKHKKKLKPNMTELKENNPKEFRSNNFYIVGIGASAGGYEACSQLLSNIPIDTGMAYVIVQHLHPDHHSALSELFGRTSKLPVTEIKDGAVVEPNHVYVIPPNTELDIFHGELRLSARGAVVPHLPIDRFLSSLAAEMGARAIGIILSGTASDGVMGLRAIKSEGGITFSQDEASAKYNGMPHSAIVSGCVDYILPPEKIAQELIYIAHHPYVKLIEATAPEGSRSNLFANKKELTDLFMMLRKATGIDFTYYKMTTLQRRINRRMILHKIDSIRDYIDYVRTHNKEVEALYQDILINVTEFFRDPDAFDLLKKEVLPRIVNKEEFSEPVRIWIPGCSTGEEAYSIAMALLEYFERDSQVVIQIFATDIDDLAIEKARQGIYRESIEENVSPQRLKRFFTKHDGGYQIKKNVRDLCIFAKQNVFKDPPFSKINLISCRNLLIYLGPVLQKRILKVFHYSLVPNGVLFLGSAETIGEYTQLFKMMDQKHKFYSKKSLATPLQMDFSIPTFSVEVDDRSEVSNKKLESWSGIDLPKKADRLLMQKYVPAAVLVDDQMQILQFRGHTGRYLEPVAGEASLNLMKMVREGLLLHLRSLLNESMEEHLFVRKEKLKYNRNGQVESVDIEITPIQHPTQAEYCYLIVFEESKRSLAVNSASSEVEAPPEVYDEKNVLVLTQELAATKEYLQSVIEQQEVSNEELRSANEEIQSSNEELQSINEELETAKEELQSTNEELATVNEELESRNSQLARLNDDHSNFVNSLNIAFMTVDDHLNIRSFTDKTKDLMNLIDSDIGRPLSDIKVKIKLPEMENIILECIEHTRPNQIEFMDNGNNWYSMRVHPYRTSDNRLDGAVVAFLDVNDIKHSLEKTTSALKYADSIIASIHHPLLVLDKDLRVVSASQSYYDVFKRTKKETIGNLLYHLGNGEWAIPKLRKQLEDVISKDRSFDDFSVEHLFDNIGLTKVNIFGRKIMNEKPEDCLALMQIELAQ